MKLNLKIFIILAVGFLLVSSLFTASSIITIQRNQNENLDLFKDEFIQESAEQIGVSAALFFELLDKEIEVQFGSENLSIEDISQIIEQIDPFGKRVVMVDLEGTYLVTGNHVPEMLNLLDQQRIELNYNRSLLSNERDFVLDNYEVFLADSTLSIVPVLTHYRIYEELGVIIGYGKALQVGKVRLNVVQIKNAEFFVAYIQTAILIFLIVGGGVLLVTLWFMRRVVISPLAQMSNSFSQISEGEFDTHVEVNSRDEIGDLANAFNSMAIQLQQSVSGLEQHVDKLQETEKALTAYTVDLERSNRELQSFAYIASHDLQEPLRKIQTFSDRMHNMYADSLDKRGLDYLIRMQSAGERMQTLIQDLLSFSHVTTHAQTFSSVDLKQTVDDVIEDLEIPIEETRAQIKVGDLPIIEADPLQMRQLFQNLISNALKFRQNGIEPIICITSELISSLEEEEVKWQILVEDNGIGFDEKYLDRIFMLFQRLHSQHEYVGTGVGLAICRKIIERHSGQITAQSKLGNGTRFIVTLPGSQL